MAMTTVLPDDIVDNILAQYSLEELLRLRCVCKRWSRLPYNLSFRQLHRRLHPNMPPALLVFLSEFDDTARRRNIYSGCIPTLLHQARRDPIELFFLHTNRWRKIGLDVIPRSGLCEILAASREIVCLRHATLAPSESAKPLEQLISEYRGRDYMPDISWRFYVFNPLTGPGSCRTIEFNIGTGGWREEGMVFDHNSGQFKLVLLEVFEEEEDTWIEVEDELSGGVMQIERDRTPTEKKTWVYDSSSGNWAMIGMRPRWHTSLGCGLQVGTNMIYWYSPEMQQLAMLDVEVGQWQFHHLPTPVERIRDAATGVELGFRGVSLVGDEEDSVYLVGLVDAEGHSWEVFTNIWKLQVSSSNGNNRYEWSNGCRIEVAWGSESHKIFNTSFAMMGNVLYCIDPGTVGVEAYDLISRSRLELPPFPANCNLSDPFLVTCQARP